MAVNFRTAYRNIVPAWMLDGDGDAVLFSLAAIKDAFLERLEQGLNARFPTRAVESALAMIGEDRGIIRGRSELAAHYAQRLVRWRWPRGHRVRGNAFALLEQIAAYWGAARVLTIDVRGNLHLREADGTESYSDGNAWDWDGAGPTPNWARFWVGLDARTVEGIAAHPDPASDSDPLYGDDAATIGMLGVTPDDGRTMLELVMPRGKGRPWKPAGTRSEWLMVSFDGSLPVPDGTWLQWSANVGGVQEPVRDAAFRYVSLNPAKNNRYAGNPDSEPASIRLVGEAGVYVPNPDTYHATITLLDGTVYTPNPDFYREDIPLVDDATAIPEAPP